MRCTRYESLTDTPTPAVKHQAREPVAVNQHDPLVLEVCSAIDRVTRECRSCKEDPFAGALSTHRAVEGLNGRSTYALLVVSLGLNVDAGKTETVFVDAAIDSPVRPASDTAP